LYIFIEDTLSLFFSEIFLFEMLLIDQMLYYVFYIKLIYSVKQFIFVDLESTREIYCVIGLKKQFNI
jgi:hypothetical protein